MLEVLWREASLFLKEELEGVEGDAFLNMKSEVFTCELAFPSGGQGES